jgi:hypothetical protein
MAKIASLPVSVLFTTLNLGTTILLSSQHSVASAGFHRNPEAFLNGIGAFQTDTDPRKALARFQADYLVLCAEGRLETTIPPLRALVNRDHPAWLSDVTDGSQPLRVFKVDRAAVADGDAPPGPTSQLCRKWGAFRLQRGNAAAPVTEADDFRHSHDCFRMDR